MKSESLVDAAGNAEVVRRIEAVPHDAQPAWGKLDAAGMLAHCQKPFRVAAGELKIKRGLLGLLLGGFAKKRYVDGDKPFGKNAPTDPKFLAPEASDVERERAVLIELVRAFQGTGATSTDPHPFFGPLSSEQWDRLMWKHMDHHLRQFGV